MSAIKYVKQNKVRIKTCKKNIITNMFIDFFDEIEGKTEGMRGYMIMNHVENEHESIVLTFWETKQQMDAYCSSNNKPLINLVEKAKSYFEEMPERSSYEISRLKCLLKF
jgi:heme-degrading monooxygenase HmoA